MNNWRCPAIDNGVTVYDDGRIRPCCVIEWEYSKPIADIHKTDRFQDLYSNGVPSVCRKCTEQELNGISSRRQRHLQLEKSKPNSTAIQYVDIRNTNLCNARCQFCGPHHTNQWPGAVLRHQDITEYMSVLFNNDLLEVYFAGGEPLISRDHYTALEYLIDNCDTSSISLRYSSNLSTLKYKDADFITMWKKFKKVLIMPSADGIGKAYEDIRVGLTWDTFEANLKKLIDNCVQIKLLLVLSNLNIWTIKETLDYFRNNRYNFSVELLHGPEHLRLRHVDDKQRAEQQIRECKLSSAQTEYIIKEIYEQE
jgi:sulfatase maturation enzyme AslB (radical SAM superfamily)